MRKLLFGVALLGAVTLSACGDDDDDGGPAGAIRVLHLSPDAPAVDVFFNGNQRVSNLAYLGSTDYSVESVGTVAVRLEPVGSNTAAIAIDVPVAINSKTTLLAVNVAASIEPLLLTDAVTLPASGANVRVVHAAPSVGAVDVYVTTPGAPLGAATLTNVPFKGASVFLPVPVGTYQVRVTPTGTQTVAINQTLTITDRTILTVVAHDAVGGGAPQGLTVFADFGP